jgi:hypothetical protein
MFYNFYQLGIIFNCLLIKFLLQSCQTTSFCQQKKFQNELKVVFSKVHPRRFVYRHVKISSAEF